MRPPCQFQHGSSPRAWGTVNQVYLDDGDFRFISTCVGNSPTAATIQSQIAVHPQVRGEQSLAESNLREGAGSSPRAWGTAKVGHDLTGHVRFIPACVGNSIRFHHTRAEIPVHPHVRGEQAAGHALAVELRGSSPRAWGTAHADVTVEFCNRFIPTCVGNSKSSAHWQAFSPVHPHVRGEQNSVRNRRALSFGSSPRAWGTDKCRIVQSGK